LTRRIQEFDSLIAHQMIETYDGLCGIIPSFAYSGLQIRCSHIMGHSGPCSFEKYRSQFRITGGSGTGSGYFDQMKDEDGLKQGFIQSVLYDLPYNNNSIFIDEDGVIKERKH
jgi:hypothetical protein